MDESTPRSAEKDLLSGTPDTWTMSAVDAARISGVSERTIRRAILRGELFAHKHGGVYRISPNDLADYRGRKGTGAPNEPRRDESPALPEPPTELIGRTNERAAAQRLLLDEGVALLTLIGPGGVGKTRLALHVATEVTESFNDGACFVDLSPVRDPALVMPRIAQAIGVHDVGRRDAGEAIVTFLRPRQVLLVLDNCEQVLAAAPSIADLLAACPTLQIMATSRAPLRLRAEHRLPVAPFEIPPPDAPVERLPGSDAIRLFLDRARAVHPAFAPNEEELRAISEICRRLDGLPLAIELAAARTALLSPRTLLEQMSDRLRLLADGPRDLPDRQRTIQDAIAWSYDLLGPEDQSLFRRLAVFTGGFDLDAAIAVAGEPLADVLGRTGTLVEQSLLRRVEGVGDKDRFAFLETVREFALMQLHEHGELDEVRWLHAEHFLTLAEHIETVLYGSEMRYWLDRLEAEHPNCLVALAYFVEIDDATRELRLAGVLSEYWYYRGQIAEGIAALEGALERGANAPPGPRARVMSELGFLVQTTGSTHIALDLLAASNALVRQTSDAFRVAQITFMWADVLRYETGRGTEAIGLLEEVIEMVEGNPSALTLYASALGDLGEVRIAQGDRERGATLLDRALKLFRDSANQLGIAQIHLRFGRLARQDGATKRAANHYAQSLRANRECRIETHVGAPLADLAGLVADSGYRETAARLTGMVQSVTDRTGAAFDQDRALAWPPGGRIAPQRQHFNASFEYGRALPLAEALSEAIAIADALAAGTPPPGERVMRPSQSHTPAPLSARERDVLALLIQRYTAPEMADQLYLSVRTVEHHIANLYNKLGVNSRRAATAAAVRHGLV